MKRFDLIDGMRGYFLVFMLINHLVFSGGFWLVEINHRQFAFVEDAQGFVFLSGLLIGMVYARKMMKYGYDVGKQMIWNRAMELYRYAMGLVIFVLFFRMIIPHAPYIWYNWLGITSFDDSLRLAAIATFLFQPTFMDILPQYIVYMVFAPMLVRLCLNGKWAYVMAGSLLIWMAGQLGLQKIMMTPLNELVKGADEQGIRVSFNLFGWQLVFYSALVMGAMTAQNHIPWKVIFSPQHTWLPKAALLICLFFMPLRIATAWGLMPEFMIGKFSPMEVRADFGPVYLINFLAVSVGLSWLVIAGPKHHRLLVSSIAEGVIWVLSLEFLQLLGRHSLQVYVWHVAIVYSVYYLDGRTAELSQVNKTLIAFVAIALLAVPVLWCERDKWIGSSGQKPAGV